MDCSRHDSAGMSPYALECWVRCWHEEKADSEIKRSSISRSTAG